MVGKGGVEAAGTGGDSGPDVAAASSADESEPDDLDSAPCMLAQSALAEQYKRLGVTEKPTKAPPGGRVPKAGPKERAGKPARGKAAPPTVPPSGRNTTATTGSGSGSGTPGAPGSDKGQRDLMKLLSIGIQGEPERWVNNFKKLQGLKCDIPVDTSKIFIQQSVKAGIAKKDMTGIRELVTITPAHEGDTADKVTMAELCGGNADALDGLQGRDPPLAPAPPPSPPRTRTSPSPALGSRSPKLPWCTVTMRGEGAKERKGQGRVWGIWPR